MRDLSAFGDELCAALEADLRGRFALLGHSMGGMLALELARALRRRDVSPERLIVSAARVPTRAPGEPPVAVSEDEALAHIRSLGGTPAVLLESAELRARILPTVCADLAILRNHRIEDGPELDCPIDALGGEADPLVLPDDLERWSACTRGAFSVAMFPGTHFFHVEQAEPVARFLIERLNP
jgi:surfactin synthase thioesterase subunit